MSHIKGGGRAALSEEVEEALTSVLLALREPDAKVATEHDRKREHKRFIKKLKNRQDRRLLTQKVNRGDNALETTSDQVKAVTGQTDNDSADNRKVRIELVEAVFRASSKNSKKGGSSSKTSKTNNPIDFKEGNKKILVFSSSTSIQDVMKEAKSKLRMKKKPVRCFLVEKKISVDLLGDLSGIKDGQKLFVTSQEQSTPKDETTKSDDTEQAPDEALEEDDIDPLEAVKQAYKQRKRQRFPRRKNASVTTEHPQFSNYFDKLPPLSPERANLPAASCREQILAALDKDRVMIICGATGCGKSTQIPQFLLEGMTAAGVRESANIVVSQPRRVAATALAQRVASEMECPEPGKNGSQVGYMVRLDRAVSDSSKIVYCTVGILLRMLVSPMEETNSTEDGSTDDSETKSPVVPLSGTDFVVIDEVHERDVNTDFALTLLRRLLSINKQIRIILMSATASAQLFVRYFEEVGMKPAVIDIPGRSFPVDIKWISECEQFAGAGVKGWSPKMDSSGDVSQAKNLSPRATAKIDYDFVKKLLGAIVRKQPRDLTKGILVFLPGKGEIEALARLLYQDPLLGDRGACKILKLHSTVPKGEQQAIFVPAPEGVVKIVLATNIAETSITINDLSHVIDCGRVKESRFNASTRIKELVTVWTSQASAKQRAGRAGRTSAGTCWRLYSEDFAIESMPEATSPEILRTPLDELVMQLCLLYENKQDEYNNSQQKQSSKGVCPIRFLSKTPEPPSDQSLIEACKHLLEVGALVVVTQEPTVLYRLTPLGYHLSKLPLDAKVGKVLLVGCLLGCLDNSLTVAASLSNTKSCFPSRWSSMKDAEWESCVLARKSLIEKGFGGSTWRGGTVKGDLTATIALYREWKKNKSDRERAVFCTKYGIDNVAMKEMSSLRSQFYDYLSDAGFVGTGMESCDSANDDAMLTSCCLVAGLYPNVCTLMRPRKGGPKGGRLLTKDGDVCRPSNGSFQTERVRNVSESGRDAYAVFHAKHRSIGTSERPGDVFLSEIDFVSRFALMLFGGELSVDKNCLLVDNWLKFKIGDKGTTGIVLIQELRSELDNLLLEHVMPVDSTQEMNPNKEKLILLLRQLLTEEV